MVLIVRAVAPYSKTQPSSGDAPPSLGAAPSTDNNNSITRTTLSTTAGGKRLSVAPSSARRDGGASAEGTSSDFGGAASSDQPVPVGRYAISQERKGQHQHARSAAAPPQQQQQVTSPTAAAASQRQQQRGLITFSRQLAPLSDLERLSRDAAARAAATAAAGGGKRRATIAPDADPREKRVSVPFRKDSSATSVGGGPFSAAPPPRAGGLKGTSALMDGGVGVAADGTKDVYTIDGFLIHDMAPPPTAATASTAPLPQSPSRELGASAGIGGASGESPRRNLLAMMQQQQQQQQSPHSIGGLLTTNFVPAPANVEESLAPLTAAIRAAAASRHNAMVVHRSAPGTNEGGFAASAAAAASAAGGAALRSKARGGADASSAAYSATTPTAAAKGGPTPPSAPALATPTPSEHYFPLLADAVLRSIVPAADRALQIVADEAAKDRQMARLRQGAGGASSAAAVEAVPQPLPSPSASPSGGQMFSIAMRGGASAQRQSVVGSGGGGEDSGTPTAAVAADGASLVSDGLGAAAVTPTAMSRGGAAALSIKGLSPALAKAVRAASARRGDGPPSAPNSARRPQTSGGGDSPRRALTARPPTAPANASSASGGGGGSARFSIYTSAADYAVPVPPHGGTLDAKGLPMRRRRGRRSGDKSVGFHGGDSDGSDSGDEGLDGGDGKGGAVPLRRTASLRRKTSMRAIEDFEANRPSPQGEGGPAAPPDPLPNNGWGSEMTALAFDGRRSYLQLPIVPDLENLVKAFTVDFWLVTDCTLEEGRRTIFHVTDQSAGRPEGGMQLSVGLNWYPDMGEGLRLYARDSSNRVCEVYIPFAGAPSGAGGLLSGSEPHHFRIVVRSLEEAHVNAFIDGEPVENIQFLQTEHAATFVRWSGYLYLGGVPSGEGGVSLRGQEVLYPLRGSIFELRFWRGEGNVYNPDAAASSFSQSMSMGAGGGGGGLRFGGFSSGGVGGGGGGKVHLTAAEMAFQEKVQGSEPWVRWPLVNPPPSSAATAAMLLLDSGAASGGGGGGPPPPFQVPPRELMQEAMGRVPKDHLEIRNDIAETRRFNPRLCPIFDGATTVVNMGTLSCFGDFMNHFEVEVVFKTTETRRCMSLVGFTDSQHKMCEMGIVLNAEPVMAAAGGGAAAAAAGAPAATPGASSLSPPSIGSAASPSAGGGAGAGSRGERYRHHEHTITFYMVDCSGRCLSAFVRGSERNNVMDGRWHSLRIRVIDAEQGAVEARIDGLARETIKVMRESPHTFLALKDWVCIGGHNDRGGKVTNMFSGQISHVNFIVRGEDFATLNFAEGPGSGVCLDQSGRRHHGLFLNPQTRRNKRHAMQWGLIFDSSSSNIQKDSQHNGQLSSRSNMGSAAATPGATSLGANGGLSMLDALLYGVAAGGGVGGGPPLLAEQQIAIMHRNNAVSVAVVQFGAVVSEGRAAEVAFDLIKNEPIDALEEAYGSLSETDRGFGPWLAIPERNFAEVANSQRLRETVSFALRHSPVRALMRHTLVAVRIGDAFTSLLDLCGPLVAPGSGVSFDRQLLKWVPHAVATDGDTNKAMAVVNDQVNGLWRCLREVSAAPNIAFKLGPRNQRPKTRYLPEAGDGYNDGGNGDNVRGAKVTATDLVGALHDAGTRWRLALAAHHLIMNAYLRTSLHFVCSLPTHATASDVESVVAPQEALLEAAKGRAAIFIQRVWRRKLAALLVRRLSDRQRARRAQADEIVNLRKTNPLVLPKKALRALVVTLHEFRHCDRFDSIDPTACDEVIASLGQQGYTIDYLRNPTRAQLSKAVASLEPDASHFVYVHGYGGYVRQRAAPPHFLDRLLVSMEEESAREAVALEGTIAFGHITKEKWEDLAAVKAAIAAAAPVKKKKKVAAAAAVGGPRSPTGAATPSPRAASPTAAATLNNTVASLGATAASAATSNPSGLNATPRRAPSGGPRGRAQQTRAQANAALLAQQHAIAEEFRIMHEDLAAAEQHRRLHGVWVIEEQSRTLLLQEFGRSLRHLHDFAGRQREAERRQAAVGAATATVRTKTRDDCGLVLLNAAMGGGNGASASAAIDGHSRHHQEAAATVPSSGWFLFPAEARRVEPTASELISVDELIAKALQRPTPPIGFQCVVAVDLVPPTPACHGGGLLCSSTGHHFTFAYDGLGCVSAFGTSANGGSSPSSPSSPSGAAAARQQRASRKSFMSLGITGGAPLPPNTASLSPFASLPTNNSGGASSPAQRLPSAAYGNTAQQQSNVLSWVLAKAFAGHAPRIAPGQKEAFLQGACDVPALSGQRDWRSFATYVASKVDLYCRNDPTMRERREAEALAKARGGTPAAAAPLLSIAAVAGGGPQALTRQQQSAANAAAASDIANQLMSNNSVASPTLARGAGFGGQQPLSSTRPTPQPQSLSTPAPAPGSPSSQRKRLSVVLAAAPPIAPQVEAMLEADRPYTADVVPLRTVPFDAEEREARRRDRVTRRVTSYARVAVEASRVVGDMQYEFRPLLKHLNVTDISMCPTVRLLLLDGNKDIDAVDEAWVATEANALLRGLNPAGELSVSGVSVKGSGIYIDVVHSKGDRTKTNQAVQFLASRTAALWGSVPLRPSAATNSEASVDYSQVIFLVKCTSPARKYRNTLKDLFLASGGTHAANTASPQAIGMAVPRHLTVLQYGLNVE